MASRHGNATELDVEPAVEATDSEVETVPEATESEAPAKTESTSTRPPIEEGYVSPIGFQKALKEQRGVDIRPQQVYSYIRNSSGENAKNPFPVHVINGRPQIKVQEGLDWWDAKEQRKSDREQAKQEKASKQAEKASTDTPAEASTDNSEVVEAE